MWTTVRAAAPPSSATVEVLVADRTLPTGHRLIADDLRTTSWPVDLAPGRAAVPAENTGPQIVGRVLSAPIEEGEPLTEARVLGPGLLEGLPAGTVAVPVRPTDPAGVALVRPGDHVDILTGAATDWSGADATGRSASGLTLTRWAARRALVLSAVPAPPADASGGSFLPGPNTAPDDSAIEALPGIVVLAVPASDVDRLNQATTTAAQVSVVLLPETSTPP